MVMLLLFSLVLLSSAARSLSSNEGNGTLYTFSCNGTAPSVMLYFEDIRYVVANSSANMSLADSGSPVQNLVGCNPSTMSLSGSTSVVASAVVSFPNDNMTFGFHFRRTNGRLFAKTETSTNTSFYWELLTITARSSKDTQATCFVPQEQNDWVIAPRKFSFSCQPVRNWIPLNVTRSWRTRNDANVLNGTCGNSSSVHATLNITGLQVQAFEFHSGQVRFDSPIDCVGYFSGPVIMGYMVGFLLLSILFITSMIFLGMNTPDRFDTTTQKAIYVGNSS